MLLGDTRNGVRQDYIYAILIDSSRRLPSITVGNFTSMASAASTIAANQGYYCSGAIVYTPGSGYANDDLITLTNGVVLKVTSTDATMITTVIINDAGNYMDDTNPVAQDTSTGLGSNALFSLTSLVLNGFIHPHYGIDRYEGHRGDNGLYIEPW